MSTIRNYLRYLRTKVRLLARVTGGFERAFGKALVDRAELAARAAESGELYRFGAREETTIAPTPSADPLPPEHRANLGDYAVPQPFVCSVPDVDLVGRYPLAVGPGGRLLVEPLTKPEVVLAHLVLSAAALGRAPLSAARSLAGGPELERACLLHTKLNDSYFHWVTDTLTRIRGVEQYELETGTEVELVVGPDPARWQLRTLELLGYDRSDLVEWDGRRTTVRELVVPTERRTVDPATVGGSGSHVGRMTGVDNGVLSPDARRWLRRRMLRSAVAAEVAGDWPARVYVSRDDTQGRRVRNESDLMGALSERGFVRYTLSDLDVAEQVALFAGADVVVGPHGAGLTNVLYCEDATLVEILPENNVRSQYFLLARAADLGYRCTRAGVELGDLAVDVSEVVRIVDEILDDGTERRRDGDEPGGAVGRR